MHAAKNHRKISRPCTLAIIRERLYELTKLIIVIMSYPRVDRIIRRVHLQIKKEAI